MLFSEEELEPWRAEWQDMPAFNHEDLTAKYQVLVSCATEGDLEAFKALLGNAKLHGTIGGVMTVWYPPQDIASYANKRYIQKAAL